MHILRSVGGRQTDWFIDSYKKTPPVFPAEITMPDIFINSQKTGSNHYLVSAWGINF